MFWPKQDWVSGGDEAMTGYPSHGYFLLPAGWLAGGLLPADTLPACPSPVTLRRSFFGFARFPTP